MKKTYKKILLAIGVWIIRWAVRMFGPVWPKSFLPTALDCFAILDKYYGQAVDIEERIDLLVNTRTPEEKLIIYQDIYHLVMTADRVKQIIQA